MFIFINMLPSTAILFVLSLGRAALCAPSGNNHNDIQARAPYPPFRIIGGIRMPSPAQLGVTDTQLYERALALMQQQQQRRQPGQSDASPLYRRADFCAPWTTADTATQLQKLPALTCLAYITEVGNQGYTISVAGSSSCSFLCSIHLLDPPPAQDPRLSRIVYVQGQAVGGPPFVSTVPATAVAGALATIIHDCQQDAQWARYGYHRAIGYPDFLVGASGTNPGSRCPGQWPI